jgi:hypothetical protein
MRADELEEQGDLGGARNWKLIVHRIGELLARTSSAAIQ